MLELVALVAWRLSVILKLCLAVVTERGNLFSKESRSPLSSSVSLRSSNSVCTASNSFHIVSIFSNRDGVSCLFC